jgi:50S ribosomal protein L16 3-hydroxylase
MSMRDFLMRQNPPMDSDTPLPLLGGLSPAQFMRRHWQKKPLLVRQAWPGVSPPLARAPLFDLAAQDDVESRLVRHTAAGWALRHGPLPRRSLPPLATPRWTLLVQGLDLHVPAAHEMLQRFDFVPHARLDDLMVSWASDGGGVGPHLDSYDVFLLQVQGRRRWRVGRSPDRTLVDGLPLKILANFQPEMEFVLEPGDMLYLPPLWGHDGVAEGECMTASIGFRAPGRRELARELLLRLADGLADDERADPVYADRGQAAVTDPGRVPPALASFGAEALQRVLADPAALDRALGEWLTEPKDKVWFDPAVETPAAHGAVRLDARTRMLYDAHHVFMNGESWRAAGRDATLLHRLADLRRLSATDRARLSEGAQGILQDWLDDGWLHDDLE